MSRRRTPAAAALWLLLPITLTACAGRAPSAEAPAPSGEKSEAVAAGEADSLGHAEAEFDDAEEQLLALGLDEQGLDEKSQVSSGDDADAGEGVAPPEAAPVGGATAPRRMASSPRDRCDIACRALGSMRRSADRLCQLTSEDDERCGNVRGRVERATTIVESVCPDCGAGG
jgi:hypothetical protein